MEDRGSLVYKCRNCRKKYAPVSYPDATDIAIRCTRDVEKMFSIHICLNGNIGIADLIAVETTDKKKHKRLAKLM
jgi:DNA-directed RNA polymerase subunit RPC12/RpoP